MTTITDASADAVRPSSLVVSSYEGGVEVIDNLADEWRELCEEAADDQPFYRPEWIQAYIRAFVPRARILLLAVRRGQRLCLLLPLVLERTTLSGVPIRKLRAPVNAHACRFDAARSSGWEGEAAIGACWDYLAKLGSWDLLEFRNAAEGSTVDRLVEAARASGFHAVQVPERPNPCVPIPADPKLLTQMPLNARLRTKLRQVRRQLTDQGPLQLKRVDTADRDAIERFYELEASGWKGQESSAIVCNPGTRQFYDEVALSAARFGYFSLYLLEWRGQLLAAHFALTHQGRYYSPKVAYNEKFKEFVPGHLIVSEILHDCVARGIQSYDITGPDDEWKMKWTGEARSVHHHSVFGHGPAGRLAFAVRFKLRPAISRLLLKRSRSGQAVPELGSIP